MSCHVYPFLEEAVNLFLGDVGHPFFEGTLFRLNQLMYLLFFSFSNASYVQIERLCHASNIFLLLVLFLPVGLLWKEAIFFLRNRWMLFFSQR